MDFEKVIEFIPIAVTCWRLEQDPKIEPNTNDFRLVYANDKASELVGFELYDLIGMKLNKIPANVSNNYPSIPDAWLRVLVTRSPEIVQKEFNKKSFEILLVPLDAKCVAVVYRDSTVEEKANKAIANIKKTQHELVEFQKKKSAESGDHKTPAPPIVRKK